MRRALPQINPELVPGRRPRRGMIAAIVVITLLVVALIGATLLRASLSQRAAIELEERTLQVDWLLEAGRGLALSRLAGDAGYPGETWKIPSSEFGGRGGARVDIEVRRDGRAKGEPPTLRVHAEYPTDSSLTVRRTEDYPVPTPTAPNGEKS